VTALLTPSIPKLYTVGRIAEVLDARADVVRRAIAAKGIRPAALAGATPIYDRAAVELIRESLAAKGVQR
jgi:hypothetical protein